VKAGHFIGGGINDRASITLPAAKENDFSEPLGRNQSF